MDRTKLIAIEQMLRHDEHTRRHWFYQVIMTPTVDSHYHGSWVIKAFQETGREVPCGSVGCAVGHAHRIGILSSDLVCDASSELDLRTVTVLDIFDSPEHDGDNSHFAVTPDVVADRIRDVLDNPAKYGEEA